MAFKGKEEGVLGSGVNGVFPGSGVYKSLHLASTTHTHHPNTNQTPTPPPSAPTFLKPSSTTTSPVTASSLSSPANAHGNPLHLGSNAANSTPTTTQVLIGNNVRMSVPSSPVLPSLGGTTTRHSHIPRALGALPSSALKMAVNTNCQMPNKVTGASTMDIGSRDNHDQDKPALNSIADNTVAMEVT
ncbi:unnamed protein product [Oncorhynchus mykiss]|nr:unnamed protein product [Oncorhynchus mykiss]